MPHARTDMEIVIDATPVVHGNRAGSRHTKNLVETLLRLDTTNDYKLLYLDWGHRQKRYIPLPADSSAQECVVSIPARFLQPSWRYLAFPKAEWMIGPFDILYASDLIFPPASRGLVLGTVRGIAYHVISEKIQPGDVAVLRRGLSYTLKHADYLLAVSYKTREELIDELGIPDDKIYVVRHGVDPRFIELEDRDTLSLRLTQKIGFSSPYILFVGVIGHHKNIMGLLKAYSILRSRKLEIPLVLAGPPGSAWEEAQGWIAKEGLEKCVHLTGLVDQDSGELTDLYNGASLFVFPSFYEGWTAPPLEAMACQTPVITSNCSSLPETVGDAALQVDPNDPEELADAMEKILTDESLRKKLIEKGCEHAASHTWEKAAQQLIEVFHDIRLKGPWKEHKK